MKALIEIIPQISTVFSLLAFLIAAYFTFKSRELKKDENLVKTLPDADRKDVVNRLSRKSKVNTDNLSKDAVKEIVLEELGLERKKIKSRQTIFISIGILALLSLILPSILNKYVKEEINWYQDIDEDGFGNISVTKLTTEKPDGYVANSDDIDDSDPNRNLVSNESIWYADLDNDGYGDDNNSKKGIKQPTRFIKKNGDCDDNDKNVFPGQTIYFTSPSIGNKTWDYNCDGKIESKFKQIGRCDGGSANPQGWEGGVPGCGEQGAWLLDCDRKIKGVPPKTYTKRETTPKKQECR